VVYISVWGGLELCLGAKPTKVPRDDGTDYQQTSILNTVLPNHARWHIVLF